MQRTNYQALFGVQQNTPKLEAQLTLYKQIGFVEDEGYQLVPGSKLPEEWFTARNIKRGDVEKFVAMKLAADPYMHIFFYSWNNLSTKAQWPPIINQIGSRSLTLLLDDVEAELARIERDFPQTKILHRSMKIERVWGTTTSALLIDPEGNFLELISIAGDKFDEKKARTPTLDDRSFLHFQINCATYDETSKFYRAFGMEHDFGVDFRKKVGFPLGWDHYAKQMNEGCDFKVDATTRCDFLRNERDVSHMHLELLETIKGNVKAPGTPPVWSQYGIMRYCMRTPDYKKAVADVKARGNKIYVEDQRGCLKWGDTQWIFYGDEDGNYLCQEQWYPTRYWNERY